jgi:hypothetical protein
MIQALYIGKQVCEDPWLFSKPKGTREQKSWSNRICFKQCKGQPVLFHHFISDPMQRDDVLSFEGQRFVFIFV